MLIHVVICSNYFDFNKTAALKTVGQQKIMIFTNFHTDFSNLSISLVQNILVLDKSQKLVSCVRVDYENKTQMLLNPSIQFFIDAQGLGAAQYLLYNRAGAESFGIHPPWPSEG